MVLQAYKDLSQVMANQQDLTEIVHRLQVPCHEHLCMISLMACCTNMPASD